MTAKNFLDVTSQFAIPIFTVGAQLALAFRYPEWSLIINILVQPFWLYSSWQAYKKAGQIGILASSVIFTIVTLAGIVNYWFF